MITVYTKRRDDPFPTVWREFATIVDMCDGLLAHRREINAPMQTEQPFVAINLDTPRPVMSVPGDVAYYALMLNDSERELLARCNRSTGWFAFCADTLPPRKVTDALKRLTTHGWINLVYEATLVCIGAGLYTVYTVTPDILDWLNAKENTHAPTPGNQLQTCAEQEVALAG